MGYSYLYRAQRRPAVLDELYAKYGKPKTETEMWLEELRLASADPYQTMEEPVNKKKQCDGI